jgi:hypothetical protein
MIAALTVIALKASSFPVLFNGSGTANRTLFYNPSVNNPFLIPILPKLVWDFSNPFSRFNSEMGMSAIVSRSKTKRV